MPAAAPTRTVRLATGVTSSYSSEDVAVSLEQASGTVGALRDSLCAARGLDAATHMLFLDSRCLNDEASADALPWDAAGCVPLRVAVGTLRIRFAGRTAPDFRMRTDLSPTRLLKDLTDQIARETGYYVTPILTVSKNVELDTTTTMVSAADEADGTDGGGDDDGGDGAAAVAAAKAAAASRTLGDTDIKLDDVVLVVRQSSTVVVAPARSDDTRTLEVEFYGQRYRVEAPNAWPIAKLKAHLCAKVFKGCAGGRMGLGAAAISLVSVPSELRVVQCNEKFDDAALVASLKRGVPLEVLRQWGPEHITRRDNFLGYGSVLFNCPFCATPGAVAELRPMCALCNSENVEVDGERRCWSDVVGTTAHCHNGCGGGVAVYYGFFCKGVCCDARCSTHRRRDMISIYDSSQDAASLLAAINSCFAYPSVAGRLDASAVDGYVAVEVVPAAAAAADGAVAIPPPLDVTGALKNAAEWATLLAPPAAATDDAEEQVGAASATADAEGAAADAGATTAEAAPAPAVTPADATGPHGPVVVGEVSQETMLGHGLQLPDTFVTQGAGGQVLQWYGMQEGYALYRADAPEAVAAGADAVIELPPLITVSGGARAADAPPAGFVLVPRADAGADGAAGAGGENASAAGGAAASSQDGWFKRLLQTEVSFFGVKWSPLTGVATRGNKKLVVKGFEQAKNRLRVTVVRSATFRSLLEGAAGAGAGAAVLAMDALGHRDAMDLFRSQFRSVDELFPTSHTPRSPVEGAGAGDGEGAGAGAAAQTQTSDGGAAEGDAVAAEGAAEAEAAAAE